MKQARTQFLRCVCLLTLGVLWLGACGGTDAGAQQPNAPKSPSAHSGTAAREGCAAMTAKVSAITGLQLRPPLELRAPNEGLLRGCTWTDEGGGLNTFGITKEPASTYDDSKAKALQPERFKPLEGFGEKAYVVPAAFEGWTACALRGSASLCVEIMGEATTAEQATQLLRLALDRF